MDNALENMKDESKQQQQEQTQQQQQQQQQAQQQSQQQQQQQQQEMAEDDTVDTEEQDVTASTETPPAADTQKDPTEPVTDGSKERLEDAATEHRVNTMRKRKATKGNCMRQTSAPAKVPSPRGALHTCSSADDRIFISYVCCDVNFKHLSGSVQGLESLEKP